MSKKILNPAILDPFANIFRVMNITEQDIIEEMQRMDFEMLSASTEMKLKQTGIEVDNIIGNEHITFSDGEPFFYDDKPVLIYIRDQIVTLLDYELENFSKFHLCYCGTLKNAENKNRFNNRYVATTRTVGDFLVNIKITGSNDYDERDVYKPLSVCKNCLRIKKMRKYFPHTHNIEENFSIEEFLNCVAKKNVKQPTLFDGADKRLSANPPLKQYELTAQEKFDLKQRHGNRCDICRRFTLPKYLQIHHKDHNEGNNSYDNLMVVCKNCHDEIHRREGGVQFMPR